MVPFMYQDSRIDCKITSSEFSVKDINEVDINDILITNSDKFNFKMARIASQLGP